MKMSTLRPSYKALSREEKLEQARKVNKWMIKKQYLHAVRDCADMDITELRICPKQVADELDIELGIAEAILYGMEKSNKLDWFVIIEQPWWKRR